MSFQDPDSPDDSHSDDRPERLRAPHRSADRGHVSQRGEDRGHAAGQHGPAPSAPREYARTRKLRLDQYLKLKGLVFTGGEAKVRIQSGEVEVNGEVETRRGLGLHPGDVIVIGGVECVVEDELFEDDGPTHAGGE